METYVPAKIYNTLGALVEQFCISTDSSVAHYFDKFLSWGFWAMREIHLDVFQATKADLFPISDLLTVTTPAGYVDWQVIGIQKSQYFKPLSASPQLNMVERTPENINFGETFPPGWLPNGVGTDSYGFFFNNFGGVALPQIGGGLPSKGFFRVLEKNGCAEIYLDRGVPGSMLYLEWITAGFNECSDETIVNEYFSDYVLKFLNHQYEKFRPIATRSEAAIFRTGRELWDAERVVRGRKNDLDRQACLTVQRQNYRLTAKS